MCGSQKAQRLSTRLYKPLQKDNKNNRRVKTRASFCSYGKVRPSKEQIMRSPVLKAIIIVASVATVIAPALAAKECYAPDPLAQRRAFSRAVTTEGGKQIWLGGQTGAPNLDFEGQVRQIFA